MAQKFKFQLHAMLIADGRSEGKGFYLESFEAGTHVMYIIVGDIGEV